MKGGGVWLDTREVVCMKERWVWLDKRGVRMNERGVV